LGTVGKVMENFHKGPDVSEAVKVGEPTLVDPKQASAPDMVRSANASVISILEGAGGGNHVGVERIDSTALPAENAPVPHSDAAPGATAPAASGDTAAATTTGAAPDAAAGSDMHNDLAPAANNGAAPVPAPVQVNDVAGSTSNSAAPSASSSSSTAQAAPANTDTESSSKKKKKHKLLPF
jgi:hypothetical protein